MTQWKANTSMTAVLVAFKPNCKTLCNSFATPFYVRLNNATFARSQIAIAFFPSGSRRKVIGNCAATCTLFGPFRRRRDFWRDKRGIKNPNASPRRLRDFVARVIVYLSLRDKRRAAIRPIGLRFTSSCVFWTGKWGRDRFTNTVTRNKRGVRQ